jgi:hypothetical protein
VKGGPKTGGKDRVTLSMITLILNGSHVGYFENLTVFMMGAY